MLCHTFANAQHVKTLSFNSLYHAGINPAGELYTLSEKGITRFDTNGDALNTQPLTNPETVVQFDAWHLTQLILYYRNKQLIEIYNPEPALRTSFIIDSAFAIEPQWIAASFDQQHFWIFDQADASVKKINRKTGEVVVDEIISTVVNQPIVSIREYQRFLFVQTQTSLFVFNALGKHLRTFAISAQQPIGFFGEELVFVSGTSAKFVSLFTNETRTLPLPSSFSAVFISDNRLFGIRQNTVEIFAFDPN